MGSKLLGVISHKFVIQQAFPFNLKASHDYKDKLLTSCLEEMKFSLAPTTI